jgi:lipopolysaccharide export system permease protein
VKIIHRYVLREHLAPLTFSLSALTWLLLINYIAKHFGDLVGKGLPSSVIGQFFVLSVPFTVAMTLPMSVLVATLYAFSRLAAENEITALKANGVSMVRLLVPVLLAAGLFSVGMVAFNDSVLPRANHRLRTLQGDIARKKPTFALREQILNEVSPQRIFLRANHINPTSGQLREVTIYDLSDPLRRRTIVADSGDMAFAANGDDLLLTLRHGYMFSVLEQDPMQLERLRFGTDFIRVAGVANQFDLTSADSYKSDREMSICELQNEVSRSEHDRDAAQANLRGALDAALKSALTGLPATLPMSAAASPPSFPGTPAPRSTHLSLGRVYCDAMRAIRRVRVPAHLALVRNASAAERGRGSRTTRATQGTASGAQDTTRRDSTKVRSDTAGVVARPDSAPAVSQSASAAGVPRSDSALAVPPPQSVPQPQAVVQAPEVMPVPSEPPGGSAYVLAAAIETSRARMIGSAREANQYAVEVHKKIAISVACLVFVLVGAPIALRFPRGGVGLVIGVSLVVFALYYVGLIAGESLSDKDLLTPFWAMWSANILLTGVGVLLLARMGRETATARGGDLHEMLEIVRGLGHRLLLRGDDEAGA